MWARRGHSKSKKRLGATVVEFAVVSPVLFLLVFGMIEFGRYMMLQQIAITATREGSRKASLANTTADQQVQTVVRDFLVAGGIPSSLAHDTGNVQVTVSPNNFGEMDSGTPITVDVRMGFGESSWLSGDFFGLADVDVRSSTTMERE